MRVLISTDLLKVLIAVLWTGRKVQPMKLFIITAMEEGRQIRLLSRKRLPNWTQKGSFTEEVVVTCRRAKGEPANVIT